MVKGLCFRVHKMKITHCQEEVTGSYWHRITLSFNSAAVMLHCWIQTGQKGGMNNYKEIQMRRIRNLNQCFLDRSSRKAGSARFVKNVSKVSLNM